MTITAKENTPAVDIAPEVTIPDTPSDFEQFRGRARSNRRRTGLDHYDSILWRLRQQFETSAGAATVLGVMGVTEGAGATTIAANLSNRMVDYAAGKVLLVDANFYRPRSERLFGLKKNPGLAEVLADDLPLSEAVQKTPHVGLELLAAGRAGMLEQLGIHPDAVQLLFSELRESYAAIVFDFSEASQLGPALLLAQQCDGVLLVARSERTRRGVAERAVKRLHADGVDVIGAVLNRQRQYVPQWLRRWT